MRSFGQLMIDFVAVFIFFFAVIDPVGTIPVFIAVTRRESDQAKRRIAIKAAAVAASVLVFFVIAGEIILGAIGIPLSAFQIAGGIVLFLFAMTMIFDDPKPEQEIELVDSSDDTAVFPLAVPSLASPGAMLAAVLLTENASYSIVQQAQTMAMMLAVMAVALVGMLLATRIQRLIGDSGASVVSRVMGLILASVATASTLEGISSYFALGTGG